MAGAAGGGGAPTLEELFSGLGSGELLPASEGYGNGGSMAEAALSASAAPASWPLDAPHGEPAFRFHDLCISLVFVLSFLHAIEMPCRCRRRRRCGPWTAPAASLPSIS